MERQQNRRGRRDAEFPPPAPWEKRTRPNQASGKTQSSTNEMTASDEEEELRLKKAAMQRKRLHGGGANFNLTSQSVGNGVSPGSSDVGGGGDGAGRERTELRGRWWDKEEWGAGGDGGAVGFSRLPKTMRMMQLNAVCFKIHYLII